MKERMIKRIFRDLLFPLLILALVIPAISASVTVTHPVINDIQKSPGYLTPNSASISAYKNILADANAGLNRNYSALSLSSSNWGDDLNAMSLVYVVTNDTRYADKTVEALVAYYQKSGTAALTPAIAYDRIYGTLDESNNTYIRNQIAINADQAFHEATSRDGQNYAYCRVDDYSMNAYTTIAPVGLILADYTNDSLKHKSTPAMWLDLGTGALFVNDTYHRGSRYGLMSCAYDKVSGKGFLDEGYTRYYEDNMYRWFNLYSAAKGHSIFDEYPEWRGVVIDDVWSSLPNRYADNIHASSLYGNYNIEFTWGLLDDANKSASRWHIAELKKNVKADLLPMSLAGTSGMTDYDVYLSYYPIYTTAAPPSYLNTLDGMQRVIRSDWTDRAEWIKFIVWDKRQGPTGQQRSTKSNPDQLGIEYYSHGEFLIPEQSDVKYLEIPQDTYSSIQEGNVLYIGNGSVSFPRISHGIRSLHNGNMVYQGSTGTNLTGRTIEKASALGTITPAKTTISIEADGIIIIGAKVNATIYDKGLNQGEKDKTFQAPVYYERDIVFPGDYMVVIDRAKSSADLDYTIANQLASLSVTRSQEPWTPWSAGMDHGTCGPIEPDEPANLKTGVPTNPYAGKIYFPHICEDKTGKVNGELTIGTEAIDWYSQQGLMVERYTPGTNNLVRWDTVNVYGDHLNFTMFTTPAANISYQKFGIRMGTGSVFSSDQGVFWNVYHPYILFNQAPAPRLDRITLFLTKYTNESACTPSELAVTGTGSATKIIHPDGSGTDYIYTGAGTSSFGNYQTDADTTFIREWANGTIYSAILINGTKLMKGGSQVFERDGAPGNIIYSRKSGWVNTKETLTEAPAIVTPTVNPIAKPTATVTRIPTNVTKTVKPTATVTRIPTNVTKTVKPTATVTKKPANVTKTVKPTATVTRIPANVTKTVKPTVTVTRIPAIVTKTVKPTATVTKKPANVTPTVTATPTSPNIIEIIIHTVVNVVEQSPIRVEVKL
jgi:hypothetical protein